MIYTHHFNFYQNKKSKDKDFLLNKYHQEFLHNTNIEMFTHSFESTEDIKFNRFMIDSIEYKLSRFGVVGFFIFENNLMCEPIFFTGEPNLLGIGEDCYCTIARKGRKFEFKKWIDNENIIIMKNNKLATTDNDIDRIANVQAELDKSYLCNIVNSRLAPLLEVSNTSVKKQIQNVIENIKDGKPQTISSIPNLIDNEEIVKILNITDVNDSSKIQYLSLAKEDVTKKFYQSNGINLNSSIKQAQQSVAEITDGSQSAFVYPINKLKARTDCIIEFEEKFNIKYTVTFSECWKQGYEMLTQDVNKLMGGENNAMESVGPDNNSDDNNNDKQSDENNNDNRTTDKPD